jgi:dCTP deaminase
VSILPDWAIRRDIKITPFHDGEKEPGKISSGLTSFGYDVRLGYVGKIFSPIHATEIDPKNFDPKMLVTIDLTPIEHDWKKSAGGGWFCDREGCKCLHGFADKPKNPGYCPNGLKPNYFRIPPHSFMLAESLEEFDIPRDVLCVVVGKSTMARCGAIVNVTPGEPEWKGKWTIEISNTTPLPLRVYAGEGIMQCLFFRSDGRREVYESALHGLLNNYMPVFVREEFDKTMNDGHTASCERSYANKKGRYQNQTGLTLPSAQTEDGK